MRARPGSSGSAAAVPPTKYTYIYGVTTGQKKSQMETFPDLENANFYHAHGTDARYARSIYIWSAACGVPAVRVRYAA